MDVMDRREAVAKKLLWKLTQIASPKDHSWKKERNSCLKTVQRKQTKKKKK